MKKYSKDIQGKDETAAIFDPKCKKGEGKVLIPSLKGVLEAKDWVDNGNQK